MVGSETQSPLHGRTDACGASDEKPEGLVLEIQRMSTEDGPGLRSTAFLKGCPLECAWCHNPESIDPRPQIQWIGLRCIAPSTRDGCGACIRACPRGALGRGRTGAVLVDRESCAGCGACAGACPGGAMELLGKRYTAQELARELLKDSAYFKSSDRGGVTLSGGEASAQGAFALETLRLCREAGTHTALDTCGVATWEGLSRLYAETDLVLYDLKEADPVRHESFTGVGNGIVFRNLENTARLMREASMPAALWIRTPVIPGATDREENLYELGRRVAAIAPPRLERWELCAFNNLCADKYRRLGREWKYARSPLMIASDMSRLARAARRGAGGFVEVSWTGSVRMGPERIETP
ncbi:MAG: glycyl-radical enzyme activating protein [Rectinemataceae bacterium]